MPDTPLKRARWEWIYRAILLVGLAVSFWISFGMRRVDWTVETRLRFLEAFLGVGFVCITGLIVEVYRQRALFRELEAAVDDLRFGSGARRDREAVDILVKALRAPDGRARETALRTLRKISGLDFGTDAGQWEEWWRAARSTFVRAGAPATDKAGSGKL